MNKYAIAVETETSGIYEVFEIMSIPEFSEEFINRWNEGTSSGNASMMHITGVPFVAIGDRIEKGKLISQGGSKKVNLADDIEVFALYSDGVVFGTISAEKGSFSEEKYMAASSGKTLVFNATGISGVVLGATWDGTQVVS